MKYRMLGMGMSVFLLVTAAFFSRAETAEGQNRVHHHLTGRRDDGCDCNGSELCSHLPLVVIDTRRQAIPGAVTEARDRFGQMTYTKAPDGDSTVRVDLKVIDNEASNNHPGDAPAFSTDCRLRVRGNTSRRFPKIPYALRFVDDKGENRDISVMGMDAHHEWVLNGPILDKSLVRNYMWYNISGEIMDYAPNARFCEVVVDGQYEGLYLMVESVTGGEDCRLNLTANVKNAQLTGYLLRYDRPTEADLETVRDIYTYSERMFQTPQDIAIRYPGQAKLTEEMAKHIELDYSAFEKALFSFDYDSDKYGYEQWIDVDSFVDYCVINEFTKNLDAGSYSTYIYKEVGGKFKLCVWDFNNSCDNYLEEAVGPGGFFINERAWYFMLMKDERFVKRVQRRYQELRKSFLSQEYLTGYIDETLKFLGPAVDRNNDRWEAEINGWGGLIPEERNLHSHEEAVEQLKGWLVARGEWLDENVHALEQYGHYSRNKVYEH